MSETKFTKSPWHVEDGHLLTGADGTIITSLEADDENWGFNNPADRTLVTAAPELYEACEDARKYLINEFDEPGLTIFWKLVAALKKARGEA